MSEFVWMVTREFHDGGIEDEIREEFDREGTAPL